MRALITGVSGFLGRHLAQRLAASRWDVHGLSRQRVARPEWQWHEGAFWDAATIDRTLRAVSPGVIVHLASAIPGPRETDRSLFEVNAIGTLVLLRAVSAACPRAVVLVVSSSAVYGRPSQLPLTEDSPFNPLTPYAASKVSQEMVAVQAFESEGLSTIRVRTFNVIGPGQPATLVTSELAVQIVKAEAQGSGDVRVGNVTPRRDFTDVRDVARALELLAVGGQPGGVYNVASERSYSVQECLDMLTAHARVPLRVVEDPARMRAADIPEQIGSAARLRASTGWQPDYSLNDSLAAVLEDHRRAAHVGTHT